MWVMGLGADGKVKKLGNSMTIYIAGALKEAGFKPGDYVKVEVGKDVVILKKVKVLEE
jgi:antitoxin component of MazEF toxin-antitoxin module